MKRGIIFIIFAIFFCSYISAEIIFREPVNEVYNLGEVVNASVSITTFADVYKSLQMDLICNGKSVNFYKNGILFTGEEQKIDASLLLIKEVIGDQGGICKIKASLDGYYILSPEFKISNLLIIEPTISQTEVKPGEKIYLNGKVIREDKKNSEGIIKAKINSDSYILTREATIDNGNFNLELMIPSRMEAGNYILILEATEKNSEGITTNYGKYEHNIVIKQTPKNIELKFEKENINPGETLKVKPILYDQSGKQINSMIYLIIKNSHNKIVEQRNVSSGEFLEYPIPPLEEPSKWKVTASFEDISVEKTFSILEKESAEIKIINKTVYATNTGNVLYNKTSLIRIGNESLNLQITLNVGESKKYALKAPDGNYDIRISSESGEINEMVTLTGKVVSVEEISEHKSMNFYLWIVIILALGGFVFISWNKVHKKSFLGKISMPDNKRKKEIPVLGGDKLKIADKAEISLSIKGEKQNAIFVCVKIRNLQSIKAKNGSAHETIKKIKDLGKESRATIYEDRDYLLFMFVPSKTRTFKNEQTALDLAEKVQNMLIEHNRKFNEKIIFGISLEQGTIVGGIEDGVFKFMNMDSGLISAKKIALISDEEILLSKKMNDLLRLSTKTEKKSEGGVTAYKINSIKRESEETKEFIQKFMERQKKD